MQRQVYLQKITDRLESYFLSYFCKKKYRKKNRRGVFLPYFIPIYRQKPCGEHDETPEHIVNGCTLARQYWIKIGVSCHRDFQCGSSIDLNALTACRNRSLGCSLPYHVGSSGKREMHRSTADHLMQDGGGKMGS